MSDTLTLVQLRTRVRERADMVNSQFVTDSELNGYINYSYKDLYDLLTEAAEDYSVTSTTTTVSSGNTFTLPADFYKLKGIDDITDSNNPLTVRKYNWNERNDLSRLFIRSPYDVSDVEYHILGNSVVLEPPENALKPYKIWYVPTVATLSLDADTADGVQGWLEYVIIDSAIKCLIKEESDIRPLQAAKQEIKERIMRLRHNRDQSLPQRISRVRNRRRSPLVGYYGEFSN